MGQVPMDLVPLLPTGRVGIVQQDGESVPDCAEVLLGAGGPRGVVGDQNGWPGRAVRWQCVLPWDVGTVEP